MENLRRLTAIKWWGNKKSEEKSELVINHSSLIIGGESRDPNTLTGMEIERLWRKEVNVHLTHCNQGEYEDLCKYGDKDCSALS